MNSFARKLIAFSLTGMMAVTAAGCAGQETIGTEPEESVAVQGVGGYVYVPQFQPLAEEGTYYNNLFFRGTEMYYSEHVWDEESQTSSQTFYRKEAGSESEPEVLMELATGTKDIMGLYVDAEKNIYSFMRDYSGQQMSAEGYREPDVYLVKYDSQGAMVFEQDVTSLFDENSYVQTLSVDAEGRIYASLSEKVLLFQADGTPAGEILAGGNWINSMGTGRDGKVYISQYSDTGGMDLTELDFNAKTLGTVYRDFPGGNGNGSLQAGVEKDFMVNDGRRLMEYDLATQTATPVLDWIDSDINGDYVETFTALEDGRIAVVVRDWNSNVTELAFLTKTRAEEVPQRQIITVGTMMQSQELQASAVNFNKKNDKYRIKVKVYLDDWSNETAYEDAMNAMNSDILSGKGPDVYAFDGNSDIANYMEKGVIEDLTPYLEASEKIHKEDFVASVVDAYTFDGKLASIPYSFQVSTVMGKTSQVGEKMGWNMDDLLALAQANPDASVFEYMTSDTALHYSLRYNQAAFVDWENATCDFDSEEFKKVLTFAAQFPAEYEYDEDMPSLPLRLQDGSVLLNEVSVSGPEDFAVNMRLFAGEPVTCIGYPTVDGSVGSMLGAANGMYGISSQSANKEGAWAFIEAVLSGEVVTDMFMYGLPANKAELDRVIEEAMTIEYVLDENGEKLLDENGEPIINTKGGWGWGNDFTIELDYCTQEEMDMLWEVINTAGAPSVNDTELMKIITEEAQGFFAGQKTVDDVAAIIQSRAKIYISEKS